MIRIGILGDIGAGKSFIANNFGYPVFNADHEVSKIYKKNKKIFYKLKSKLPKYIYSYPINKNEITSAILANKTNLKKIIKIVHKEIRKKIYIFLKKNKRKKIVILDIPLLLENRINKKNDVLIYVQSKNSEVLKRLNKRKNFNKKLLKYLKKFNFHLIIKKKSLNLLSKIILQKRQLLKK